MPNIITRGALSAQGFGFAGGVFISDTHFIGTLIGSDSVITQACVTDTSGNIYLAGGGGFVDPAYGGLLVKYGASGGLSFQKEIVNTFSNGAYGGIAIDFSRNTYLVSTSGLIQKYDVNQVSQWAQYISGVYPYRYSAAIAVNSGGDVFTCNYEEYVGYWGVFKLNSSGAIQWGTFNGDDLSTDGAITLDSSANVYVAYTAEYSGLQSVRVLKYNSSGVMWSCLRLFWKCLCLRIGWQLCSCSWFCCKI
jgi:hypothetical protein